MLTTLAIIATTLSCPNGQEPICPILTNRCSCRERGSNENQYRTTAPVADDPNNNPDPDPDPDPDPNDPPTDPDPDLDKGNNGHGNDDDGNDDSNPGGSNDPNDDTDDDGVPPGQQ